MWIPSARSDYRFHSALVRALEKRGDAAGLIQALGDPTRWRSYTVRADAAAGLRRLRRAEFAPIFTRLLRDADPWVRANAAAELARQGGRAATRALASVVDDPSVLVRSQAIIGLGLHGDTDAVALLVPRLEARNWLLERGAAIASLLAIGDPVGVEAAVGQLRRERFTRRRAMRKWAEKTSELRREAQAASPAGDGAEISAGALDEPEARLDWALDVSNAVAVVPYDHEHDLDIASAAVRARYGTGRVVPMTSSFRVLGASADEIREARALVDVRIDDHDLALVTSVRRWDDSTGSWVGESA